MFETRKAYIILKMYNTTGAVLPLGVIEDEKIAKRMVSEFALIWDDEDVQIRAMETSIYETASAACIGINEKLDKFNRK